MQNGRKKNHRQNSTKKDNNNKYIEKENSMIKKIIILGVALFMCIGIFSGCSNSYGEFYTLQKAYDEGLLTVADLQTITTHRTDGTSARGILRAEIVSEIKELAAINARKNEKIEAAKAEDFQIEKYYGTYNGSIVIMLNHPYYDYPAVILDVNETIAGVVFHYSDPSRIIVWRNKI